MPRGTRVGQAYVKVLADGTGMDRDIERELEGVDKGLKNSRVRNRAAFKDFFSELFDNIDADLDKFGEAIATRIEFDKTFDKALDDPRLNKVFQFAAERHGKQYGDEFITDLSATIRAKARKDLGFQNFFSDLLSNSPQGKDLPILEEIDDIAIALSKSFAERERVQAAADKKRIDAEVATGQKLMAAGRRIRAMDLADRLKSEKKIVAAAEKAEAEIEKIRKKRVIDEQDRANQITAIENRLLLAQGKILQKEARNRIKLRQNELKAQTALLIENFKEQNKNSQLSIRDQKKSLVDLDRQLRVLSETFHDVDFDSDIGRRFIKFRQDVSTAREDLHGFTNGLDRVADRSALLFGKGSRNDFLNFFGRGTGALARIPALFSRLGTFGAKLGGEFKEIFSLMRQGQGLFSAFSKVAGESGSALSTLGASIGSVGVAGLILIPILTIVTTLMSGLLGIVVALASTISLALVGSIGVLAGTFSALTVAIGLGVLAFKNLSDVQKDLLSSSFKPVSTEASRLGRIMAGQVSQDFATWGSNVRASLTGLAPLARRMGQAFGEVGNELTASLSGPGFTLFKQGLTKLLPNITKNFGSAFTKTLSGLAGLFAALLPSVEEFSEFLSKVAGDFDRWASSAEGQNEIADFMDRALDSAEALGDFLGELGGLLNDLLFNRTGGEIGNGIFDDMTQGIANFRAFIADGGIEEWFVNAGNLADGLGVALKGLGDIINALADPGAMDAIVLSFQLFGDLLSGLAPILKVVSKGVTILGAGFQFFTGDLDGAAKSLFGLVPGFLRGANSAKNMEPFITKAGHATGIATGEFQSFAGTLDVASGAIRQATREAALLNLQQSGAILAGRKLGLSAETLLNASLGQRDALKAVNKALRDNADAGFDMFDAITVVNGSIGANRDELRKQRVDITNGLITMGKFSKALPGLFPKNLVTEIKLNGIAAVRADIVRVIGQYKLVRPQIVTILRAAGIVPTKKLIDDLIKKGEEWRDLHPTTDVDANTQPAVIKLEALAKLARTVIDLLSFQGPKNFFIPGGNTNDPSGAGPNKKPQTTAPRLTGDASRGIPPRPLVIPLVIKPPTKKQRLSLTQQAKQIVKDFSIDPRKIVNTLAISLNKIPSALETITANTAKQIAAAMVDHANESVESAFEALQDASEELLDKNNKANRRAFRRAQVAYRAALAEFAKAQQAANNLLRRTGANVSPIKLAFFELNEALTDAIKSASTSTSADGVFSAFSALADQYKSAAESVVESAASGVADATISLLEATTLRQRRIARAALTKSQQELNAAIAGYAKSLDVEKILEAQSSLGDLADSIVLPDGRILRKKFEALAEGLTAQNVTLADFAEARGVVANKIADAQSALESAIGVRDSFREQIASGLKAYGSILEAQASVIDGVTQNLTATDIVTTLQQRLDKIKKFSSDLAILVARGLSDDAYKQLVEAGPETGAAFVEAILAGGQGAVGSINQLTGAIATEADKLGLAASNRLYQAGVDTAKGFLAGLESLDDELEAAAARLGDAIAAQIKRTLGIASPSKVAIALMGQLGDGMVIGLDRAVVPVSAAAARLGSSVAVGVRPPEGPFASGQAGGVSGGKVIDMSGWTVQSDTADPNAVAHEVLNEVVAKLL